MLDERSTTVALAASRPQIAVFGIGAIEQHGRHLPIGTDWIAVSEVARRVAAELQAWLIPPIPFSMSECHGSLAGTVWLKPATLAAILRDVVISLREQGINNVLVLNGHGGNFVLEPTIQQLNQEFPDLRLIMPAAVLPTNDVEPIFETADQEVHAGEIETSTQLYLNPEHVKAERIDYVPRVGREFLDYVVMSQISAEGVWGQASHGDAIKGERAIAGQVRAVVDFAKRTFERLDASC